MSLVGINCEPIEAKFRAIQGIKQCYIYGKETLSSLIRDNHRLRMLIPRVYGLGNLEQILDERAYSQVKAILSSIGDDLQKFVIT